MKQENKAVKKLVSKTELSYSKLSEELRANLRRISLDEDRAPNPGIVPGSEPFEHQTTTDLYIRGINVFLHCLSAIPGKRNRNYVPRLTYGSLNQSTGLFEVYQVGDLVGNR